MTFDDVLTQILDLLKRQGRVSYSALKRRFDLDDDYLNDLKDELLFAHPVVDADHRGLVWTGDTASGQEVAIPSAQPTQPLAAQEQPALPVAPRPPAPPPDAERRQLTVLFCDLVDSTRLASQLDPEEWREVVRAYQETCAKVIARYEGHIAQYLGDGLLVYFGWPQAHEDDAQRAVRTGLGVIEALGQLNTHLEQERGVQLAVRLGVHTGLVVVGDVGGGTRQEQLALGETPNLAARLQGIAAPNTLVISAATSQLLGGFFVCQSLGTPPLRGIAQPLAAYQVLYESRARSRLEAAGSTGLTPLVGREQEVALLRECWAQVKDGMGHVVLLSGEAGIGKSRLVQVLQEHLAAEPQAWLTPCQCSPYYQHTALYPMIDLLERVALRWEREESPQQKCRKLEGFLVQYGVPLAEAMPLLTALLSLPLAAEYPPLTVSPEQQKQRTLHALLTILLRIATQQPVLFVMEDLHWVDPTTLEFLSLLIDQGPTTHILTLLTCRPDFSPPWTGRAHLTQMTLHRLPRRQAAEMTGQVAHGKALPAEVVEQVVAKTDGVPLFVEELTKMVLESGLLQERAERYELRGPLPPLAIPTTLHDSLMARLDRLAPVKVVAQLGATIGRTFSYALLHAIASLDEATLQTGLRHLVEAELLYQQGLGPQATYIFKHALLQEAAYQSLLKSTRQLYHQRIAQVLEAQFPEIVATQPALLAHHAWQAEQWAMAARAFQEAGARALARSAYREAVACFDHALAALRRFPDRGYRETGEQVITALFGLRGALVQLGDLDRALTVLHEAETLAQTLDEPQQLGRVSSYMARYCFLMGEHSVARTAGERALKLAMQHQDVGLQVAAQMYLGQVYHALGQYPRAVDVLEQNNRMLIDDLRYEHLGMANLPVVTSLAFLTYCLAEQGAFEAGRKYSAEGIRIAETAGHANSLAIACLGSGRLALNAGDLPQAIPALERGLHLCQHAHIALLFSAMAAALGYAYALAGRVAEALPLLDQVHETAPLPSPLSSLVLVWLSEITHHAGRLEAAQALAEQALKLAQTRQEGGNHAWALHVCGTLARPGDPAQACAYYEQSRRLADDLGMRPLQAHCRHGLGTLYAATGQREQARTELSTAIEMYRDMEMTFWLPQTEAVLAKVEGR